MSKLWRKIPIVVSGLLASLVVFGSAASAETYQYDAQGRVVSVTYPNGKVVTYTYDAAGNRVQVTTS